MGSVNLDAVSRPDQDGATAADGVNWFGENPVEETIDVIKKHPAYGPLERSRLIQKYNQFIADEKFLLDREKAAEKNKL